jgi:hypothetical protein
VCNDSIGRWWRKAARGCAVVVVLIVVVIVCVCEGIVVRALCVVIIVYA